MPGVTLSATARLPLAPPEAFALLASPDRAPEWQLGLVAWHWGRLPPDQPGRTFVVERRLADRTARFPAEITAWEPPSRLAWRILQDQLTVDRGVVVLPDGTGCRVELSLALQPVTTIARLGMPWFSREARRRLAEEAARLATLAGA